MTNRSGQQNIFVRWQQFFSCHMIGCGAEEPKFKSCWLCSAMHTLQCFRLDQCTLVLPLEKCKMSIWEFVCLHFLSSNLKLRQHSSGSCKELKITRRRSSNIFSTLSEDATLASTCQSTRRHFCYLSEELFINWPFDIFSKPTPSGDPLSMMFNKSLEHYYW